MFDDWENIHDVRSRECRLVLIIKVILSQQHLQADLKCERPKIQNNIKYQKDKG